MKRTNRGKTIFIVLTALAVLMLWISTCVVCSLCYLAFGPIPSDVEQTDFVPIEQEFSTDYYELVLLDAYWRTGDAPQVSFRPLGVKMVFLSIKKVPTC